MSFYFDVQERRKTEQQRTDHQILIFPCSFSFKTLPRIGKLGMWTLFHILSVCRKWGCFYSVFQKTVFQKDLRLHRRQWCHQTCFFVFLPYILSQIRSLFYVFVLGPYIFFHVNAHKTEYMCYNETGDITTLDGTTLKLVDKFTYLGSSVSSTEKDIDTRLTKAWTAIDRLTDKMKRSFFQAAVVSILLYGCITWTLAKRLKKNNYTRMLRVILNKSWRQHPTRHQLYGHLPPIYPRQTNQTCRTLLEKQGWAHKRCTSMDPHIWPGKSRTTSTNIHSAAMWGYGM